MIYQNMQSSSTEENCGPIMFVPKDHMLKLYFLGVTRFGDGHEDAVTMKRKCLPSKRQRPGNQASES